MPANADHRLVSGLAGLAELLGEPMTQTRMAGYLLALSECEPDDLIGAMGQAARTCKFFPKPCELIEMAKLIGAKRADAIRAQLRDAEATAYQALPNAEDREQAERDRARIEQFRRDYPEILAAPPEQRFELWMKRMRPLLRGMRS